MISPIDIMWNGKLYEAGKTIPATEKKLIASLSATSESADEPAIVADDEPAIKGKK
jgi:hypothetical protein